MTKLFIGLSLILVFCGLVYPESENYCHDKESWKEWDALPSKNKNDMEVQALHALKIGQCAKNENRTGKNCKSINIKAMQHEPKRRCFHGKRISVNHHYFVGHLW
jgi:hypothetical protein